MHSSLFRPQATLDDHAAAQAHLANTFYFTSLTAMGAAFKADPFVGTTLLEGAQNPPRTIFLKAAASF